MRIIIFLILTLQYILPDIAYQQEKENDITIDEAIKAIHLCLHWFGEDPYNQDRAAEIDKGVQRDCPIAYEGAIKAYKFYPENKELAWRLILLMDSNYFEVENAELKKLCMNSRPYFKNQMKTLNWTNINPAYERFCHYQTE